MSDSLLYRSSNLFPAFEEIKKAKIFNDEEIRVMLKTREQFEYNFKMQPKTMEDYLNYVVFLGKVISKINKQCPDKSTSIINGIWNYKKKVFKEALLHFPEELRLWNSFIMFLKGARFTSEVSVAYKKMIQYQKHEQSVWLEYGAWEYYEVKNLEESLLILFKGLQHHPEDTELYTLYFKIYIIEAGKLDPVKNIKGNTMSELDYGLIKAVAVYQTSKKLIRKVDYVSDLLGICEAYTYTKSVQKVFIDDMMNLYSREEKSWHIIAQRELRGFHACDLNDGKRATGTDQAPDGYDLVKDENGFYRRSLKRRIEMCYEVYMQACATLQTERMWTFFVNAMIELNQDRSTKPNLKKAKLLSALKAGHEANHLSADHYNIYISMLTESKVDNEEMLAIFQKATTLHQYSVKLWEKWIYYNIKLNNEEQIYAVFRRACKKLASESFPLWHIVIQYYQTRYDIVERLEQIFLEACDQTAPIFMVFRPRYLDWTVLVKNLDAARELYNALRLNPPYCLELHRRMEVLEAQAFKPNIEKWRLCHENACEDFGVTQTDVWIDFIKFERDFGNVKQMSVIYERAKESLLPDLVDNFISEYNLLKI